MFEEEDEILIDRNKNVSNDMSIPSSTQDSVNTIVNDSKAELVKNGSKEMLKGAVLGSVLGAILSLWRKKSVWMGVLAGGLAGGYLSKENIINLERDE
ncbi:hypothetical protein N8587_01465 [Akkermansiaceae bacterium]|jgi:hypothetical protein|nr:hypothetical protein [Akkermansiaceae bacterium]